MFELTSDDAPIAAWRKGGYRTRTITTGGTDVLVVRFTARASTRPGVGIALRTYDISEWEFYAASVYKLPT